MRKLFNQTQILLCNKSIVLRSDPRCRMAIKKPGIAARPFFFGKRGYQFSLDGLALG
jgi:hypothetical protein